MKVQIVSGFLGSGKTTFLNRYLACLQGTVAVIENEFGPAGLDAQILGEDIPVREISAGCICCSMATDFQQELAELEQNYHPEYLLIEPSGVGRLSDVIKACTAQDYVIDKLITMVDLSSYEDYSEAFGEFYLDQIRSANLILPTCFQQMTRSHREKLMQCLHEQNPQALLYGEDWLELDDDSLMGLVELSSSVTKNPMLCQSSLPAHEIFSSIAFGDISDFSEEELKQSLIQLNNPDFGQVLRAKGFAQSKDGRWMRFDFTPNKITVTQVNRAKEKKIVLIGCCLKKEPLYQLFH